MGEGVGVRAPGLERCRQEKERAHGKSERAAAAGGESMEAIAGEKRQEGCAGVEVLGGTEDGRAGESDDRHGEKSVQPDEEAVGAARAELEVGSRARTGGSGPCSQECGGASNREHQRGDGERQ